MDGIDSQFLVAHRDFLKAIARQLSRDVAAADDAAQEATLVALTHEPRNAGSEVSMRGWLATIARNFALRGRRADALLKRHARDLEHATRRTQPPTPEEILEIEQTRRRVVAGVLALDEPYRSTILLRFYRDLSPRAIARAQGVPIETVKTRLKRGLERLRRALESENGGPTNLRVALAPLVGVTQFETAIFLSFAGALVMKPIGWVSAAAFLTGVTALIVYGYLPTDTPPRSDTAAERAAGSPPMLADSPELVVNELPLDPVVRAEVEIPAGAEPVSARLEGVVLLPSGSGAAGARVEAFAFESDRETILPGRQPTEREHVPPLATGDADAEGRFSLSFGAKTPLDPVQIRVDHEGYPTARVAEWPIARFATVRLAAGLTLFGRVTRKRDGASLPGTRLQCWFRDDATRMVETSTDQSGAYRFTGLPPIDFFLTALPPEGILPSGEMVGAAPGSILEQNFEIEDGIVVRGKVTDRATGAPIAGAEVGIGYTVTHRPSLTDANGRYELRGFGGTRLFEINLHCRADGYGRTETADLAVAPGESERTIDFALMAANRAVGRLVALDGSAVAGARLHAFACASDPSVLAETWDRSPACRFDHQSATSNDDGTFAIENLRPDLAHALLVEHPLHGAVALDFPATEESDRQSPAIELGTIVLPEPRRLEGIVVDERDQPLADVVVFLEGSDSERFARSKDAKAYVDSRSARTRVDGRFAFRNLSHGDYVLTARLESTAKSVKREIHIAAEQDPEPLVLSIVRGLSIRGRIVAENGDVPGVPLNVVASNLQTRQSAMTSMRPDGTFEIWGLDPGEFVIRLLPFDDENLLATGAGYAIHDVPGIAAGTVDLVLTLPACVAIRGRVLMSDGSPATTGLVYALDSTGGTITNTEIVAGGCFALRMSPGTSATVEARVAPLGPKFKVESMSPSRRARKENVPAGESGIELQLP